MNGSDDGGMMGEFRRFGGWLLAGVLVAGLGVSGLGAQGGLTADDVARLRARLEDWPLLSRYRGENALDGAPKAGERRVVFLGDSLTDRWHGRMAKDFPGKPYLNRGISSQTTGQMVLRMQQDVVQLQPEAVVILAGTSDIAGNNGPETLGQIEDNFRSMVAIAKAAHIRVVLCSDLPVDLLPWASRLKPAAEVKELNGWLEAYARTEKLTFLNYYPALVSATGGMRADLAADGVHPNDAGYAVMAPLASAAIARALAGAKP